MGPASVQRLLSLHDPTDAAVLGHLAAHRVLTTSQIARVLDRPLRTVEHRMARLRGAGLVAGERPPRRVGSAPFHWSLTASGVAFVTGVRPRRNPRRLSPFHLAHAAAVSDFAVALATVGQSAGIGMARWLREEEGWETWRSEGRDEGICPDGVLVANVDHEGERFETAAFVEVDMGTMSQPRLRSKVLRYLRYAHERRWEGRWESCPPVLFVFGSELRASTFLDGVVRLRSGRLRNLAWTASADAADLVVAVCAAVFDPDAAVGDAVWRTTPGASPVRLADLLAHAAASSAARRRQREEETRRRVEQARTRELVELWGGLLRDVVGIGEALAEATGEPRHADAAAAFVRRAYPGPRAWDLDQRWAEVDAPLAEELRQWRADRSTGPSDALVAAMDDALVERCRSQARRLLRAVDTLGVGAHPYVRRAAVALAAGRLVEDSRVWSRIEEPWDADARESEAIAKYRASRDAAVQASLRRLGVVARARARREVMAEEHDRRHLCACSECGHDVLLVGGRRPERCPRCEGRVVAYEDRPVLPSTADALDALRRLVIAHG